MTATSLTVHGGALAAAGSAGACEAPVGRAVGEPFPVPAPCAPAPLVPAPAPGVLAAPCAGAVFEAVSAVPGVPGVDRAAAGSVRRPWCPWRPRRRR